MRRDSASMSLWASSLLLACSAHSCSTSAPASDAPASAASGAPPATATDIPAAPHAGWTRIDPPAAAGALGASLTATSEGVLATWIETRGEDAHAVRFASLRGDEWSPASSVVESADLIANWADFPRSTLGGDGAVYVHYLLRSGSAAYAYEIQLMRRRAGAEAFESLGTPHHDGTPTEHGFVSMIPDPGGIRLFWLDGRASVEDGPTAVYSSRVGESVGDEIRVDDRTCDCCQTDAALGRDGPLVVYRDREEGEIRDIAIARWSGDGFHAGEPVHRDEWEMAGCPVNGPAIAADGERVAVAWFTGADGGSTRLAFSDDAGESFDAPIMVDAAQPLGRVDVALLDGGAAISWLARTEGHAELRVRFVRRDGYLGAASVVAQTASARASGFPVLARDAERLLVAYRDDGETPRVHVSRLPLSELARQAAEEALAPRHARLEAGDAMPDATLRGEDDRPIALASLAADKPLVVAFFARWCQPCRAELPQLELLRQRLGNSAQVVAVSLDEGPIARAVPVARRWGFDGRVLGDSGAASSLGVPPIPALFVFDARGILRAAWRGQAASADEVMERVGPL